MSSGRFRPARLVTPRMPRPVGRWRRAGPRSRFDEFRPGHRPPSTIACAGGLHIGDGIAAEQGGPPGVGEIPVGSSVFVTSCDCRIICPAQDMAVEGGRAVGVGRPHRDVSDIAMLDAGDGAGQPAPLSIQRWPNGSMMVALRRSVVLVDLALDGRAVSRAFCRAASVSATCSIRLTETRPAQEPLVRVLDVRRPDTARRQRLRFPRAQFARRPSRLDHRLRRRRRHRCTRRSPHVRSPRTGRAALPAAGPSQPRPARLNSEMASVGAAHDNSFTSRGQGQCGLQALAQSRRERRIGLHRKVFGVQHARHDGRSITCLLPDTGF